MFFFLAVYFACPSHISFANRQSDVCWGRNNGAGQAVNMKCACLFVSVKWAALCGSQHEPCDPMLRRQARHWDILPLQSPQRVPRTPVEWEQREGCRVWGGVGEQVQSMGGAIPAAICFLIRRLGPCVPSDTPRGDTLPNPCPVAMAPRFGLTSAHVPSQPEGPPPLLASAEGGKEKEEEDGWMDRSACIDKHVKVRSPGLFVW